MPFFDIFLIGQTVYRKSTHTDLYLNALSQPQNLGFSATLVHRAQTIADAQSLPQELDHLRRVFLHNSCNHWDSNWAFTKTQQHEKASRSGGKSGTGVASLFWVNFLQGAKTSWQI